MMDHWLFWYWSVGLVVTCWTFWQHRDEIYREVEFIPDLVRMPAIFITLFITSFVWLPGMVYVGIVCK